jgi:hypothetical protein
MANTASWINVRTYRAPVFLHFGVPPADGLIAPIELAVESEQLTKVRVRCEVVTSVIGTFCYLCLRSGQAKEWCRLQDLNLRPPDYKFWFAIDQPSPRGCKGVKKCMFYWISVIPRDHGVLREFGGSVTPVLPRGGGAGVETSHLKTDSRTTRTA